MLKKKFVSMSLAASLCLGIFSMGTASAQSINTATSVETLQIKYTGTIKFTPSYVVPNYAGYSLVAGKNVKQAYVNYTRDGNSVTTTGGRVYTGTAQSKFDPLSRSATATAWDTVNPVASKTKFNYGWIYF